MQKQTRSNAVAKEDQDFLDALKAQMPPNMPAQRILAITSQFVGQLIALQDRRIITPEMALQVVQENIEIGNQAAMLAVGPVAGSG